jgi:hypothetical protein
MKLYTGVNSPPPAPEVSKRLKRVGEYERKISWLTEL